MQNLSCVNDYYATFWKIGHFKLGNDLFSKMATTQFLDVFEEETNKMKENLISLIIT